MTNVAILKEDLKTKKDESKKTDASKNKYDPKNEKVCPPGIQYPLNLKIKPNYC